MNIDYSKIKALVIDDFAEFRRSVKAMVEQLGVAEVDQAGDIKEAIVHCENKRYHLILSDYNLGDGADGQQFLEALHHRQLISPQTIFLMVTAENSTAMVMGALEYTPDGYLTKPFNKAALKARLDKLVARNHVLAPIHKAVSQQIYTRAIEECDKVISTNKRYKMSCLKMKAELLEELHQYEEAGIIYAQIIESRSQAWALLGAGRCLFYQGKLEPAKNLFCECIEQFPMFIAAYDWLAKVQNRQGQLPQAQETLTKATDFSPKAILRQIELAKICEQNGDKEGAQKAWRNSVKLGRYSVYKSPTNYINLAKSIAEGIKDEAVLNKHYAEEEMQKVLAELQDEFDQDPASALQTKLVSAIAKKNADKQDAAKILYLEAEKLHADIAKRVQPPPEATLDLCIGLDTYKVEQEKVDEMMADFVARNSDDEALMKKMEDHFGTGTKFEANKEANAINVKGVELFEQGDIDAAIENFRNAFQKSQKNTSIILNFAQALLTKARQTDKHQYLVMESLTCLNNCKDLGENHPQNNRYRELLKIASKLRASSALKGN